MSPEDITVIPNTSQIQFGPIKISKKWAKLAVEMYI